MSEEKIVIELVPQIDANYEILKNLEENLRLAYCDGIYAHGKLENLLGYDRLQVIVPEDIFSIDYIKFYPNANFGRKQFYFNLSPLMFLEGIYECNVLGVNKPCVGYFWTIEKEELNLTVYGNINLTVSKWRQKGLVLLPDDKENIEFANKHYLMKSVLI